MAVVNELPSFSGGDNGSIAFVGVGWVTNKGSNAYGLGYALYVDQEYFIQPDSQTIVAQKDFDVWIILCQGFAGSGSGRRIMFNPPAGGQGDFLTTPTGSYVQANMKKHITNGEVLSVWQENTASGFSVGAVIILIE